MIGRWNGWSILIVIDTAAHACFVNTPHRSAVHINKRFVCESVKRVSDAGPAVISTQRVQCRQRPSNSASFRLLVEDVTQCMNSLRCKPRNNSALEHQRYTNESSSKTSIFNRVVAPAVVGGNCSSIGTMRPLVGQRRGWLDRREQELDRERDIETEREPERDADRAEDRQTMIKCLFKRLIVLQWLATSSYRQLWSASSLYFRVATVRATLILHHHVTGSCEQPGILGSAQQRDAPTRPLCAMARRFKTALCGIDFNN